VESSAKAPSTAPSTKDFVGTTPLGPDSTEDRSAFTLQLPISEEPMRRFQSHSIFLGFLFLATLLAAVPIASGAGAEELFPRPAELEPDVGFWIRVYSEVDTGSGLIHDSRHLGVVYEVIQLPTGVSHRGRERYVEKVKKGYRKILLRLAGGKRSGLSSQEARVLALWPEDVSNKTLSAAASRLRFQLGQADKFRAGVIRSGAWKDYIEGVFAEQGLPIELAALPHVESSFTPHAYSRVGAAGLWQFTRSTGRRFMRVDHVVDERLDPFRATVAAARLMKQNRQVTGSWPLAITAYNHGASGMRRATRQTGTHDIAVIARNYKSRTFGFASRNFYVEFLAALEVSQNHERHFGRLVLDTPVDYEYFELPYYTKASTLIDALGIDRGTFEEHNPALRSPIWRGAKYVPRRFSLRVPRELLARPVAAVVDDLPEEHRHAAQTRDLTYRVRRGDTLSSIAKRFHLRTSELVTLNGLRSRHRIYVGQKLKLPDRGGSSVASRAVTRRTAATGEAPEDGLYTVRRGDTLEDIAYRFGVSEHYLLSNNDLRSRHRIYVGQTLRVAPAAASSTPAAPASTKLAPAAPPAPASAEPSASEQAHALLAEAPPSAKELSAPLAAEPELPAAVAIEEPPAVELSTEAPASAQPASAEPAAADEPALAAAAGSLADSGDLLAAASPAQAAPDGSVPAEEGPILDAESFEHAEDAQKAAEAATLVADPSDYSVASNHTIEVQAAETLGHYAEWLDVRASQLRDINGLRYGTAIGIGHRIELDFSRVDRAEFERRRIQYHRELQEEFFSRYEIEGTKTHVTRRGDSIWVLAERKYRIPIWLLRQYNPDVDFAALHAGTEITVPRLRTRSDWSSSSTETATSESAAHRTS
jgi:membrane-bound lytic murein transglycosylase D